jgi:hypothetical protein
MPLLLAHHPLRYSAGRQYHCYMPKTTGFCMEFRGRENGGFLRAAGGSFAAGFLHGHPCCLPITLRGLWPLPRCHDVQKLPHESERIDLVVVPAGREAPQLCLELRAPGRGRNVVQQQPVARPDRITAGSCSLMAAASRRYPVARRGPSTANTPRSWSVTIR